MLRQAVILAGGKGTRLGELSIDTPKPMLEIGGKPFLEYIIRNLKFYGLEKILLCVSYLADRIESYFGDGSWLGVQIDYAYEHKPADTGGFLIEAKDKLLDEFLVINGDTLFDVNYWDLYRRLCNKKAVGAMAVRKEDEASRYGSIEIRDSFVTGFAEKHVSGSSLINGGVYIFKKSITDYVSYSPVSLEKDILPLLVSDSQLIAKEYNGFFIDIGLPKSLEQAKHSVPKWFKKPIAFLDRDGVINKDNGYVCSIDDFEWIKGAIDAVYQLNTSGYRVVLITNQSGIGRGKYSHSDFIKLTDWMNQVLKRYGAHIDAIYYCPHHPTEALGEYRKDCKCRKPKPGMIHKAFAEIDSDKDQSFLIGDKASDIQAAKAAGIQGYLFDPENEDLKLFVSSLLKNI